MPTWSSPRSRRARGEVVETLREFPVLTDPAPGAPHERTGHHRNTSSMPGARGHGLYRVTIAGTTGRWVSMAFPADSRPVGLRPPRDVRRLESGQEAFPAYLGRSSPRSMNEPVLWSERRHTRLGDIGGTVSPAGGDFEEPVTQSTLKNGAFHGLSRAVPTPEAIRPSTRWTAGVSIRASCPQIN